MADYYVELGDPDVSNGDGSQNDPFHIDDTTALDDLLDQTGHYSAGPVIASGDRIIFKDGVYTGIRVNNTDKDGVTFKAENDLGAEVLWNAAGAPYGANTGGTATFTIEGFKLYGTTAISGNTLQSSGTKITFKRCWYDFLSNSNWALIDTGSKGHPPCVWEECIIRHKSNTANSEGLFRRFDGWEILNSTIVLRDHNNVFRETDGATLKNSILYGEEAIAASFLNGTTWVEKANNWGFQCGSDDSFLGTTDPLFIDFSSLDLKLRPSSPCIGKAV